MAGPQDCNGWDVDGLYKHLGYSPVHYNDIPFQEMPASPDKTSMWMVSWGEPIKPRTRIQHIRGRVSDAWAVLTGAKRAMSDKDLADLMDC